MKKSKWYSWLLLFVLVGCKNSSVSSSEIEEVNETTIINGDFEAGQTESWIGWTKTGSAFSVRGIVNSPSINNVLVEKTGNYFFNGLEGGTQKMKGSLTSNKFTLGGLGQIAFQMGAGKHSTIHVDFYSSESSSPIATITNTDYQEPYITQQLIRKIVDLSAYTNKTVWINIVDDDDTDDTGYVNLDDFVIIQNATDLAQYQTQRSSQLTRFLPADFSEDPTSSTIQNGGFEAGNLSGWKVESGFAFSGSSIDLTSNFYWGDCLVYGNGEYYLNGLNTNELATGKIRSSKFTLSGDGFISFMIGGGANNLYVALNDGNTGNELVKVSNTTFNDPHLPHTLRRVYIDASAYIGQVLYISINDNNDTNVFGFINVDDFRVSLTSDAVKALMIEQFNSIMNETYDSHFENLEYIRQYYMNYDYPFPLPILKIATPISNKILSGVSSLDITQFAQEAVITRGEEHIDAVISKVTFAEIEYTENLNNFDISTNGIYTVSYGAQFNNEKVNATFTITSVNTSNIINGDFETGDLTGWSIEGSINSVAAISSLNTATANNIPFNKTGEYFFNGELASTQGSSKYALKSDLFTLAGSGWIGFKLGGNAAYIKVYKNTTLVGYYSNYAYSETGVPFIANGARTITLTQYYADLSEYIGQELSIEIGDNSDGFAYIDSINAYYPTIPTLGSDSVEDSHTTGTTGANVAIPHLFSNNAFVRNGGFETGDMTGWTHPFNSNPVIGETHYWPQQLPYNQAGNYHFSGWPTETGLDEPLTYTFTSSNFRLTGSGWISLRMGGHASAVRVYDASNNSLLGEYRQTRYSDVNFPNLDLGGSWCDMATYAIDLSEHLNKNLYLELCDLPCVGFANSFFDEVITYYPTAPNWASLGDTVTLYNPERLFVIPWVLGIKI
jgi:hypothetical protein